MSDDNDTHDDLLAEVAAFCQRRGLQYDPEDVRRWASGRRGTAATDLDAYAALAHDVDRRLASDSAQVRASVAGQVPAMRDAILALCAEVRRLRSGLEEALDGWADARGYNEDDEPIVRLGYLLLRPVDKKGPDQ